MQVLANVNTISYQRVCNHFSMFVTSPDLYCELSLQLSIRLIYMDMNSVSPAIPKLKLKKTSFLDGTVQKQTVAWFNHLKKIKQENKYI